MSSSTDTTRIERIEQLLATIAQQLETLATAADDIAEAVTARWEHDQARAAARDAERQVQAQPRRQAPAPRAAAPKPNANELRDMPHPCESCGRAFKSRRPDARTCFTCWKAAQEADKPDGATDPPAHGPY